MIDPKYIELMNLEVDGKASEGQRADLRRYLASNPAASSHFEDLARVVRRLDAQPMAEPPAELHPRVMSALEHAVRIPARRGFAGWFAGVSASSRRRTLSTFGLGIATGVFLLAAVQFGGSGSWDAIRGVDPSFLSGTMAPPATDPVARIDLDAAADGLGGVIEMSTVQGVTVIEARLESADPVTWTLDFEPGLAVSRIEAPAGSAFGASSGEIHARHAGSGNYRIVLSGRADPVESVVLKVVRDGQVVVERPAAPVH